MSSCLCCFRCSLWNEAGFNSGHTRLENMPAVKLDTSHMGQDVVIVKSGKRICGTGAAIANAPVVQDKAYFEAKIQSSGIWGIGFATKKCDMNVVPLGADTESWVLRQDGSFYHNNIEKLKLPMPLQEGDVLGFSFDHIEFNIHLNGENLNNPITGIKGTLFPVFYVDDGAIMDVQFTSFYHKPPSGFEEIMIEKSLL